MLHRTVIIVGAVVLLLTLSPSLATRSRAAESRLADIVGTRATPTAPGAARCKSDTILVALKSGASVEPLIARYGGSWSPLLPGTFIVIVNRSALVSTLRALRSEVTVEAAELDAYGSRPEGVVRVPGAIPCL